jgi:predicted KAP-like P-loop ATPase
MSTLDLFSTDKALENPEADKLDYAHFAEELAKSLVNMPCQDGFVTAIYGSWGLGKSTLVNFVQHYIENSTIKRKENIKTIVLRFDPWFYSGEEGLLRTFFNCLNIKVGFDLQEEDRAAINALSSFSKAISATQLDKLHPALFIGNKIAGLLKASPKDLQRLKKDAEEKLKKSKLKILFIIDDIDRLTTEEMRQIFKVVKTVADFPNVIYLLAFDREVVERCLNGIQGVEGKGSEYLQKIIQAPFELPTPDKNKLHSLFLEKLDILLKDTTSSTFDQDRWTNVYLDSIDYFIRTPRDIIRLLNVLSITYPSIKNDVNTIDFIAVEVLRLYFPDIYDLLRNNSDYFVETTVISANHTEVDFSKFHNSWTENLNNEVGKHVRYLIAYLFPRLDSILDVDIKYWENRRNHRLELRICCDEFFDRYFRLTLPVEAIEIQEINNAIELMKDRSSIRDFLLHKTKSSKYNIIRIKNLIERSEDYAEDRIPKDYISEAIHGFVNSADSLIFEEKNLDPGPFEIHIQVYILRVINKLLKRIAPKDRLDILKDVAKSGESLGFVSYIISIFEREKEKIETKQISEQIIPSEALSELGEIILKRIEEAANDGALVSHPQLPLLLARWKTWQHEDKVQKWFQEKMQNDEDLLKVLELFMTKTREDTIDYRTTPKFKYRLDPIFFKDYIELKTLTDRVKEISKRTDLLGEQKILSETYLKEADLRSSGQDPNFALY